MLKNTAGQGMYVYAHDTAADTAKTGDAANITATLSIDGGTTAALGDTNPTEIGGGVYWFDLTQAETNADSLALVPVSSTVDVQLDPVLIDTTPDPAPVVEAGFDEAALLRLLAAAMFGKASGGGGSTITFRDLGDTKDRITATVDADGNRTAVVLDAS